MTLIFGGSGGPPPPGPIFVLSSDPGCEVCFSDSTNDCESIAGIDQKDLILTDTKRQNTKM